MTLLAIADPPHTAVWVPAAIGAYLMLMAIWWRHRRR